MHSLPSFKTVPQTPQALVSEVERLIALPEAWLRISRLIDQERGAAEIAAAIEIDTDLSARLLRIVNSAFYRLASPVETITRAVTIIGATDLRDLAFLTVAKRQFTDIPQDLMNIERFWSDAMSTGIHAATLGRYCHLLHPERAFVMGMIHNIGQLVICRYLPAQAREALYIADGDHELLPEAEREVLGYDHQAVGDALLQRWGLPIPLREVAGCHHDPGRAGTSHLEVAIVHVASLLSATKASVVEDVIERVQPDARELIGLDIAVLERIRAEAQPQIEEISRRFAG